MERRFGTILQGRGQSRIFMSQAMLDKLERMTKRVVGRQIDQRVLMDLAKYKLEFPSMSTTIPSLILSSPNVKIIAFVKNLDLSSIGGNTYSDVLTLGIDSHTQPELMGNWTDVIVDTRILLKSDKVTPDSLTTNFESEPQANLYYDGTLVAGLHGLTLETEVHELPASSQDGLKRLMSFNSYV